jgi:hypothetical protein
MNSLLKLATEAHGGVDRWNHLKSLKAHLSVTGGIWYVKGRPDVLKDIQIELPLREERLTTQPAICFLAWQRNAGKHNSGAQ